MTEGKREIVRSLLAEYDIKDAHDIQEALKDLLGSTIKEMVSEIERIAPDVPKTYAEKLRTRIKELIGDSVQIPEEKIALEAAIFADKCSIAEELTRLHSHMDHMEKIIGETGQPDGKRLDFLVQEMNREANTILSKSTDLKISDRGIALKTDIEKVREQIQNIE